MEVYFSEEYENNDFLLIEAPNAIIDSIKKEDELILKGGDVTILSTNEKCYELKYLETTNSYILLGGKTDSPNDHMQIDQIEKKEIKLMTNHTLECQEYTPKKYSVYNILKHDCTLFYDKHSGEDNFNTFEVKYSLKDLFTISELCLNDFNKMISHFGIFIKNNYACVFDENFLFQLIDDILIFISRRNLNYNQLCIDDVFSPDFLEVHSQYSKFLYKITFPEKQAIIQTVFEPVSNSMDNFDFYKLNLEKTKLFCAKSIFNAKKEANFKLEDFITLLKNTLRVSLPYEMIQQITEEEFKFTENQEEGDDNLIEGYKDFDLRFLKGFCVVYFLKTQRDPLIKFIDISNLSEKFRERLNELFKIKEKWTLKELKLFLQDLNVNSLEEKLGNFLRLVPEPNPFDTKKQINYYLLKYKLY